MRRSTGRAEKKAEKAAPAKTAAAPIADPAEKAAPEKRAAVPAVIPARTAAAPAETETDPAAGTAARTAAPVRPAEKAAGTAPVRTSAGSPRAAMTIQAVKAAVPEAMKAEAVLKTPYTIQTAVRTAGALRTEGQHLPQPPARGLTISGSREAS